MGGAANQQTGAVVGQQTVTVQRSKGRPFEPGGGGSLGGAGGGSDPYLLHSHAYQVVFANANPQAEVVPDKALSSYNNYFYGDSKHWASQCKEYQVVTFKNIYPGIDLRYYTNDGLLKYDLVVHPGADPGQIVLNYQGQDGLSIKKNQLLVKTSVGTVKELEPLSYQTTVNGRASVQCRYVIRGGNKVSFALGNYSPDAPLVIDPTEKFCSFTGSRSDNWGYTATYDNAGNLYAGGIALQYPDASGNLFGTTTGAYQSTFKGGDGSEGIAGQDRQNGNFIYYDYDVAIIKFNAGGSAKLYATYLGGSGDEQPHSMVCDPQGNLVVTGRTSSIDFPPGASSYIGNASSPGFDLFVAKLSANGSTLIGAKRIGGKGDDGVNNSPKYVNAYGVGAVDLRLNYGDDGRSEVILDNANNIYIAASTRPSTRPESSGVEDFPITGGVFQGTFGGGDQDGVLLKLTPDVGSLLFSSYIGGGSTDAAFVLALNPTNNIIYVAGGTKSGDLKGTGNGSVYQASQPGGVDGFISMVSNDGSTLLKTTYFGTAGGTDMIYGIGFDKKGFPYITGTTNSVIPVVNSPFNQGEQASGKQFITKLQPDLSGIVYSANFGPSGLTYPCISPTAFLIDRCENVYVSGWGGGIDASDGREKYANSGVAGLKTTPDAIKGSTDQDKADFYFFVLQKNATAQLYGSFFGQSGGELGDHVDGSTSRFDDQGVIYQAICANCGGGATFPTTTGAAYTSNGALSIGGCNEAVVKIAFQFAGVAAGLKSVTHGRGDSVGCIPLAVSFQDTIRNAKSYVWNFGDGTIVNTTNSSMDHTYTAVGNYLVMLVAIDSSSCNVADTAYRTIEVRDNPAFLDFRYDKNGPCDQFNYIFTNLSTHGPGAPDFVDTSFTWNFGDGSASVRGGLTDKPTHSYSPGTYNVTLSLVDTNYCNYPLDTVKLLYVVMNVKAQFTTPAFGCAPYTAVFANTSIAGQKFYWNFGDGSPIDSSLSPSHLYANVGVYTVTLTAIDSATCNITDTYTFTITVQGKPVAGFTFTPLPPLPPNTPTVFTDASTPAAKYQWIFGDGSSETKTTPDTVIHQYNKTDTFRACLVVTNESGCTDTVCHDVPAVINPLLDVPNAFTPGRFGQNAIIKVVGFGIEQMVWRIYNRWGQMIFESNNPYIGWDGTYRGQLQPMDVYGYTLEVKYSDGTHTSKKGDITLIR